jgi:hypothetical protein
MDGRLLLLEGGSEQRETSEMSAAEHQAASLQEAADRANAEAARAAETLWLLRREEVKRQAAARLALREAEVAAQQAARRQLRQGKIEQRLAARSDAEPEWLAEAERALGRWPEPGRQTLEAGAERKPEGAEPEVEELRRTVAALQAQVQAMRRAEEERITEGLAVMGMQPAQGAARAQGRREAAVLRLQAAERGRAARGVAGARRRATAQEASEGRAAAREAAATRMQAAARGRAARIWAEKGRQSRIGVATCERESSARRMQAVARARHARRVAAGLRRQAAARAWRARQRRAAALQPQEEGADREFQAAREAARQAVGRARRAVVRLQAAGRGHAARVEFRGAQQAAVRVQAMARGWAERRRQVRTEAVGLVTGRLPQVEAEDLAREVGRSKEAACQRVRAALTARDGATAPAEQKETQAQQEVVTAEASARYEADMELWGLTEKGDLSRLEGAIGRLQGVASLEVRTEARQVAAGWRRMAQQKEQVRKDARHAKELQRIDAARDGEAVLAAMLRASAMPREEGEALEGALEAAYAEVRVAQEEAERRQGRERPAGGPEGRNAGGPSGAGRPEETRVRKAAAEARAVRKAVGEARARAAHFEAMIRADAALKAYKESERAASKRVSWGTDAGGVHRRCWEGPQGRGAQGRRGHAQTNVGASPRGR